jgi:hypothetical protein
VPFGRIRLEKSALDNNAPSSPKLLLSVDWDYFSGSAELVFDSPFWGTRDTDFDRFEAWKARTLKRGGSGFEVLNDDFPLFGNPLELLKFASLPCYASVSHSDAYDLIQHLGISSVVNLDSHHDLYSLSGDPTRVRPGNWAGLALEHGLISSYACIYPDWHENVRVTEGFDLSRTRLELPSRFSNVEIDFQRGDLELEPEAVSAVLLVQSPAWTNPLYDPVFLELCNTLNAQIISPLLERPFRHNAKTPM